MQYKTKRGGKNPSKYGVAAAAAVMMAAPANGMGSH